jgi:hypothetical protein
VYITVRFPTREARDERWRELRRAGRKHVIRTTTQEQDEVRLANGKRVPGEMVWLVKYPAS